MLPFRHNPDDASRHGPGGPPPPPPPMGGPGPGPPPSGASVLLISSTISRDMTQAGANGVLVPSNLPSLAPPMGGHRMELASTSQYSSDSGSYLPPRRASTDFGSPSEDSVYYSDNGYNHSAGSSDDSSIYTDESDETDTIPPYGRRSLYTWRKRLQLRKRLSSPRYQHKFARKPPGLERAVASVPDLGVYRTWDPRMARKQMKKIKKSWVTPKRKGKASLPKKTKFHPPGLESLLSRSIEEYAGYDLLDNSTQSQLYGHLIDTIARLRSEVKYLRYEARRQPQDCIKCKTADLAAKKAKREEGVEKEEKPVIRHQVLHRIFCENGGHYHNCSVYEDEPTRRKGRTGEDMELRGDKRVVNMDQFCAQNPDTVFILFKEHHCYKIDPLIIDIVERSDRKKLRISLRNERLRIVSTILQKALNHVAQCPPYETTGRAEMAAPYLFLYHHRRLLKEYASAKGGEIADHISLLLAFIDEHYEAEYQEAESQFSAGIVTQKHIEKLYRPNDIVIDKNGLKDKALVVGSWLGPDLLGNLQLPCWYWEYDGLYLKREGYNLIINSPVDDGSPLSVIGVVPIAMTDDKTLDYLRERGKKFWSMNEQHFTCYSGYDVDKTRFHTKARFMIDTSTYFRMHRRPSPPPLNVVQQFDPWPPSVHRDVTPDDSMIMLLPPSIYGFDLQEKKWVKLYIEQIHPIQWNKKAFDQLVLDKRTKELVKALVEVRISAERMEDVIEGKGNGLIMLLHGSPGTGKTLTAESVAEIAEKPLYRVTCGDLGTTATTVERYMQTVLYLGKAWDCVLLLDEADVFLEERSIGTADLERNSLVSVFLRILEYYDGILILTSNRVGIFDEAFKSRIQVSLHYEDHTASARKAIWKNFITMLENAEANVNIGELEDHLEDLAQEEMNGRQIRNAMTTARQLAVHRKQRLDWTHLEQALLTAKEFDRYLKKVQGGHTDKQWARDNRWR